jgi:hypothetical protein
METVFYYHDGAAAFFVSLLVWVLVFLAVMEFAHSDSYAELFVTFRTLKDKLLAFFIFGFIKNDVIITLRTTNAFHNK